jgi:hypothetical protein
MHCGTIATLHGKFWQWLKNHIVQDVPGSDGLCEYDCRKQQCTEEEWANCGRQIRRAAGELWPGTKLPRFPEAIDDCSTLVSQSEYEQALARRKCAPFQSLFNGDALAQAVLAELRRCGIEYRRVEGDGPTVTDPELIEAVRRGIDCFLRGSFGSSHNNESFPPAA